MPEIGSLPKSTFLSAFSGKNIRINTGVDMKTCTKCKETKDESEFYFNKRSYIFIARCKTCTIQIQKEKQILPENAERIKKYQGEYRCKNKDYFHEYNKVYYQNNRDRIVEQVKKYYRENLTHIKISKKEHYLNNYEHYKEYRKKYYSENKEKLLEHSKEYGKIYNKTEHARYLRLAKDQRRRSLERNLPSTLTRDEWIDILSQQSNKCARCGKEFCDNIKPQQDHIIPVVKGGGYVKENIQALCKSCNSSKGAK